LKHFKILYIGHDPALLRVRSAVLTGAGHQVKVVTPYWALLLLRNDYYDAVILCHTLAKWESRLLRFQIESLGRKTPVVQLRSSVQGAAAHVDPCVNSEEILGPLYRRWKPNVTSTQRPVSFDVQLGGKALAAKVFGVAFSVLFPFLRQVIQRKDCRHGTNRDARSAVDALDWVDIQHLFFRERFRILLGVDAVHWARIDARRIFRPNARLCNNVSHNLCLFRSTC